MLGNQVDEAVCRALDETGAHRELALALKRRLNWHCSDRTASARLSQYLNRRDRHRFPACALGDLIRLTGRDYVTPILLRIHLRRPKRVRPSLRKSA